MGKKPGSQEATGLAGRPGWCVKISRILRPGHALPDWAARTGIETQAVTSPQTLAWALLSDHCLLGRRATRREIARRLASKT
jgi:hypothetical protein